MIGIDVIDLNDPLFHKGERASFRFITHPEDSFDSRLHAYWHLWSAKEAVFKAFREPFRPFCPKTIPVKILNQHDCVSFSSGPFTGRIYEEREWILAVCSRHDLEDLICRIIQIDHKKASTAIRTEVSNYFLDHHHMSVRVTKDPDTGLPVLHHNSAPLSFSHHGRFGAFACLAEKTGAKVSAFELKIEQIL